MNDNTLVQDLRDLASFLEDNTELADTITSPTFYLFSYNKEEWQRKLHLLGSFEKSSDNYSLQGIKKFGRLSIQASVDHMYVCEKHITGTETVTREVYPDDVVPTVEVEEIDTYEWICPPSWKD